MPIYEYQCTACLHEFEALQKISADPLVECPDCGKPTLKKLVSAAAFRLKGGGWYETDFKKDNQRNIAGKDTDKDTGNKPAAKSTPAEKKKTTGTDKA